MILHCPIPAHILILIDENGFAFVHNVSTLADCFKIHDLVSKRIVCRSQGLIYIVHIALKISFDLTPIENLTKEVRISD